VDRITQPFTPVKVEIILFSAKRDVLSRAQVSRKLAVEQACVMFDNARAKGYSRMSVGFYEAGKLIRLCPSRASVRAFTF
jgi:hypothetical protein